MSAPGYPMPANNLAAAAHDPTAVVGVRTVAWIVDALLYLLVIAFVSATPLSPLAEYGDNPQDLSQTEACDFLNDTQDATQCFLVGDRVYWTEGDDFLIQAAAWLGFVVAYIVLQGVTGWTPGKLLLGLRTVSEDGQKPGIVKSLIRSVLWIVDALPCIPLVGFVCALTSTGHRRVGDMAAKTFVVRKGDAGRPIVLPGMALTGVAPAPYGTPAGYPGAPPYQSPGPAPAPGAPGAWGAPPAPTAPPPPVWGTPAPAAPSVPSAPAPAAPVSPTPGPGDTARYDVPFGSGAAPVPVPAPPTDDTAPTVIAPVVIPGPDDTAHTEIAPAVQADAESPGAEEVEDTSSAIDALADEGPIDASSDEGPFDEGPFDDTPTAAADEAPPSEDVESSSTDSTAEEPIPEPSDAEPAMPDAPADEPEPEPAAPAEPSEAEASPAASETQQQGDSPYQPQWDAARGAYIQWDPNRSRWLQWDDTGKEWKPI